MLGFLFLYYTIFRTERIILLKYLKM